MDLPPVLLRCLDNQASSISLVIGAGCSMEPPTCLKSAREYSEELFETLLRHEVIEDGCCADTGDLSQVTQAAVAATGSQIAAVECLPVRDFQDAEPNAGHLIVAALLLEGHVAYLLTVNFDLALTHALRQLRDRSDYRVTVVDGPKFHSRLSNQSLIYLHGNATAAADEWILTTEKLEEAGDNWRQLISERVIGLPVTVFAGLGTPIAAVGESVQRIRRAIPEPDNIFQVDVAARTDSMVFATLGIEDDHYLQGSWGNFTTAIADYVVDRQLSALQETFAEMDADEDWGLGDANDLAEQLRGGGLVFFGCTRAAWLGKSGYLPWSEPGVPWLAELIIALRFLEEAGGLQARLSDDGIVEFLPHGGRVRLFHACGNRWSRADPLTTLGQLRDVATIVCTGGHGPDPSEFATPSNIVGDGDADDLIDGAHVARVFTLDGLRTDPNLARQVVR